LLSATEIFQSLHLKVSFNLSAYAEQSLSTATNDGWDCAVVSPAWIILWFSF